MGSSSAGEGNHLYSSHGVAIFSRLIQLLILVFLNAEAAVMMCGCSRGSAMAGSPLAPLAPPGAV